MDYVEVALTIADSNMELSLKKIEIMKLKSELGRKLEVCSGCFLFFLAISILIVPILFVIFYYSAIKNIKNEISKIDFILNELEYCESV